MYVRSLKVKHWSLKNTSISLFFFNFVFFFFRIYKSSNWNTSCNYIVCEVIRAFALFTLPSDNKRIERGESRPLFPVDAVATRPLFDFRNNQCTNIETNNIAIVLYYCIIDKLIWYVYIKVNSKKIVNWQKSNNNFIELMELIQKFI